MGPRFLLLPAVIMFLVFTLVCCTNRNTAEAHQAVEDDSTATYPEEFIRTKLAEGADTIIYSRRVQMNCCEFDNVFWTKGGKHHFNNFYWQVADSSSGGYSMVMHTKEIDLVSDSIFITLAANYDRLMTDSIISVFNSLDHYSFTDLTIYTKWDSLDVRIHDSDFYKPEIGNDLTAKQPKAVIKPSRYTYRSNKASAWYKLHLVIEQEILASPQITMEEKKHQSIYIDK